MNKSLWLIIIIICICPINIQAQEYEDYIHTQQDRAIDYDNIQETIDGIAMEQVNEESLNFRTLINKIISNELELSVMNLFKLGIESILEEVFLNKDFMMQLILITIIIAIFTNFTSAFDSKYISEVGFFVTYLILSAILITTFQMVSQVAETVISQSLTFMYALVPSYFSTVALSGSYSSTIMFHQTTLLLIGIIDWFILKALLPLINIVVLLEIANNITEEHILSKLTELIKGGISWTLKTITMLFFGLNILQSLTLPLVDTVTNKSIKNAMQIVPVVGPTLDGVADTVLGSTMIIKNAVGVGGVIILITICFIPIIKIIAFILMYKGVAAIIQPISNKRVVNCLSGIGESTKLLLGAVFTVVLLFVISIAIISIATNTLYISR
ncbi:stage III sporulation protein AE [Natranaerovirga hydrolytica]|uniref:Stage III sporulation protein AE n=1 Tax=Natranaerovirga hydrolytica TaxID=680378 RepID=A0A4R1N2X4_9FIRM|nr:stage III sporulation protein AE [Natranaerovirga hydrolytica]TCK98364.1 stage III sporulation protein AE [Natranaerovirga hydrolytica]